MSSVHFMHHGHGPTLPRNLFLVTTGRSGRRCHAWFCGANIEYRSALFESAQRPNQPGHKIIQV